MKPLFRCWRRLIGLLMASVLAVVWLPLVSQASLLDLVPPLQQQTDLPPSGDQTMEGRYELAKVRILGVPAISIASAIPLGGNEGIAASTRARVIEGNLRALYDPNQLCSFSERGSEWMLDSLLSTEGHVCTAGQRLRVCILKPYPSLGDVGSKAEAMDDTNEYLYSFLTATTNASAEKQLDALELMHTEWSTA